MTTKVEKQENYESIKNQLNNFISELSKKKGYVLLSSDYDNEMYSKDDKPNVFINKSEVNAFKTVITSDSFKNAVQEAKEKLNIESGDDHDFMFLNKKDALDTLTQVVAAEKGLADPYGENLELTDEEYEKLVAEKGEDMWWVYAGLGEERAESLKNEIEAVVNEVLRRSGMPKSWFQYVVSCLLGTDFLSYHIKVDSEHAERVQVVNVEKDFVDLRIYKGIKKDEYHDCWKAIEDYLTHNVPAGLVRVENEGSKIYNDMANGASNSQLRAEYRKTHKSQTREEITINTHKIIKTRTKYKKIKT